MNATTNTPANIQTTAKSSTQLILSKKSSAIEGSFKNENFSGADQCINLTLRDFHKCESNQSLTNNERSLLVIKYLKGGARNSISKRLTHECLIKWFLITYMQDITHHMEGCLSNRSWLSKL